jgi:hypothetical protein
MGAASDHGSGLRYLLEKFSLSPIAELIVGWRVAIRNTVRLRRTIGHAAVEVTRNRRRRSERMKSPVIDQLLSIFRPIYKYFERNVVIGRYGIHEIFLLLDEQPEMLGPEAKRVAERRERIRHALAAIIDRSKKADRLSTREPGYAIAQMLLWLHWCNVQSWLSAKSPKAEAGLKGLRRLFLTVINGLGPKVGDARR